MKTWKQMMVGSALAAAAALGTGCTDVSSSDIKTQGISAHMSIMADGTGATTATTYLKVDTNATDYVQLAPPDTLTVTVGSQTQTMSSSNVAGIITYSTGFTGQDAAGSQYTVALKRGTGDVSAPLSTATLPSPFSITAPAASQTFSRANQDIVVNYGTAQQTDQMGWSISGDCVNILAGQSLSGDPGTFTITKGSLVVQNQNQAQNANCQATVTLTRTRAGTLDPAYFGGAISAVQQRTFTFTSTP